MSPSPGKRGNGYIQILGRQKSMYPYLSSDKPNRGRQPELDLAKFIAIFLMIACHCGIYFFEEGTKVYHVFDRIGGEFAAPVFMVCMGIGGVFSQHNQPKQLIARGVKLMLSGYLLNFVRGTLPISILLLLGASDLPIGIAASFYMIDILPFAGLAMILMGLFKKWKIEPFYQMMIGLLMAGAGEILAGVSTGYEWIDAICGLVWGTNDWACFPLLNWFIFPAAGVFFGEILMHCNDKKKLYIRLLPIGAIGVALSYYQSITDYNAYYPLGYYYYMGIKNVVYGLCYPMFLFALCYFISEKYNLGENRFVTFCSRNLNTIYCISWVLILWTACAGFYLSGGQRVGQISGIAFTLLTVAVFVFSFVLCYLWKTITGKHKKTE